MGEATAAGASSVVERAAEEVHAVGAQQARRCGHRALRPRLHRIALRISP
jgi:hypothetical protein